jgi:hypothetical protein
LVSFVTKIVPPDVDLNFYCFVIGVGFMTTGPSSREGREKLFFGRITFVSRCPSGSESINLHKNQYA